jgi:thiamine phosphate synthase YjbQ (UPF0047 family)
VRQAAYELTVETRGRGLVEITDPVRRWTAGQGMATGLLTQVQLSIPVMGGAPVLGTWQGVYLFEHRRAPHRRRIALHLIGD